MDRTQLTGIYDEEYAAAYDDRFLLDAWPKHGADFELSVVEATIPEGGRWLDVGCGTGWFLSRLPHIARAGLDYSPAMLAKARAANPDALFMEEGSFLDEHPEWHGSFDLVTSTWQPYLYVDSVWQVERFMENLAAWTKPGGAVFIPLLDLEDIRPGVDLPYVAAPDVFGGTIALTSITWTWVEPNGKCHEHMVSPQAGHFAEVLSAAFRKVEILRYPPFEKDGVARKAVLATGRRGPDDDGAPAEVVWHERPDHPEEVAERQEEARRRAEDDRARVEADAAGAAAWAAAEAELHDRLVAGDAALAREREAASHPPHVCPPPTSAAPLPTGALVKELARRVGPSDGRIWKAAGRKVKKVLPGR